MGNTTQIGALLGQSSPIPNSPAATPPTFGGSPGGAPTGGGDPNMLEIIKKILAAGVPKQQLAQPVPRGVPGQQSNEIPGYMQHQGWGFERFAQTMGTNIKNAVATHKQNQLSDAESKWNQLTTLIQGGDQNRVQSWLVANQKSLKKMAEALNQDWLNPEKTDVWKQALTNTMQQQQKKQQAAQGIQGLFQKLVAPLKAQGQQPQLNPQQQQQMAGQIMQKAPIATPQQNPQELANTAKSILEIEQAQKAAKDNYQVSADANGRMFAVNKTNPRDIIPLTDAQGTPITAAKKPGTTPSVVQLGGVPYGVKRDGQLLTPGDPGWTGADAKLLEASKGAMVAGNKDKDRRIQLAASSRLATYMQSRLYGVIDDTGKESMLPAATIAANPDKYSPLGGAAKAMSQSAVFNDLHYASDQIKEALVGLGPEGFDSKARAEFLLALRANDPHSAFQQFLSSDAAAALTDKQVNFVTAVSAAQEAVMMLRSVGGMGAGSNMVREAIEKMVPGPGTPSQSYGLRQLQILNGQISRLEKAVPSTAATPRGASAGGPPKGATMKVPGSDGKMHWSDGKKDLGVAE